MYLTISKKLTSRYAFESRLHLLLTWLVQPARSLERTLQVGKNRAD